MNYFFSIEFYSEAKYDFTCRSMTHCRFLKRGHNNVFPWPNHRMDNILAM